MNYTAGTDARSERRAGLLRALGAAVRARRTDLGLTMRTLAVRAGVSERFLAQLESGDGNISVARLQDVAEVLGTSAAALLASPVGVAAPRRVVALLGLRGAGKSTLGPEVARRLGVAFYELDALVARRAGMPLPMIFEIHGEAWFRRVEQDALRDFLDGHEAGVLATGGSIVTAPETYTLLRTRATTVWLRAKPKDHWDRVLRQGDVRPMRDRADAMGELEALLRARAPLYALAEHVVDTSSATFAEAATQIVGALQLPARPTEREDHARSAARPKGADSNALSRASGERKKRSRRR
jgi:XRE family aerobic/anaerobic benzoate catabolism transcriptional regulator